MFSCIPLEEGLGVSCAPLSPFGSAISSLSLLAQPSLEFDRVTEDPRETVNIVDLGSPLDVTKKPNVCAQMNSYLQRPAVIVTADRVTIGYSDTVTFSFDVNLRVCHCNHSLLYHSGQFCCS